MKKIILASQSPRRRELLGRLVPEFEVMADSAEEVMIPGERPEDTVRRLARQKAEHVAGRAGRDALVVAADTVVALDNRILGKPRDAAEAFSMLSALSGNTHRVYTGLAVMDAAAGRAAVEFEATEVRFRALSEAEIRAYIRSGEPMDKAGAYGIQGRGRLLVSGIEGDWANVVGLPVARVVRELEALFGRRDLVAHCLGAQG